VKTFLLLCTLQAIGFEGDVRKREDAIRVVESTFKHFGRLDILVNAAAGNFLVPSEDLSSNGFRTGWFLFLSTSIICAVGFDFKNFLNIFWSLVRLFQLNFRLLNFFLVI